MSLLLHSLILWLEIINGSTEDQDPVIKPKVRYL